MTLRRFTIACSWLVLMTAAGLSVALAIFEISGQNGTSVGVLQTHSGLAAFSFSTYVSLPIFVCVAFAGFVFPVRSPWAGWLGRGAFSAVGVSCTASLAAVLLNMPISSAAWGWLLLLPYWSGLLAAFALDRCDFRNSHAKGAKQPPIRILGGAAAVVLLFGLTLGIAGFTHAVDCETFRPTSFAWRTEKLETAHRMVACDSLDGLTQESVIKLLGRTEDSGGSRELSYSLDAMIGFGPGFLTVAFDAHGRVVRSDIVSD